MPSVTRQDDYYNIDSSRALIIDNGAHTCRVGWAGEDEPRINFRNVLHRPRLKPSGELVNIVGDYDPALSRFLDFTRSSFRSAFDANVVYQFETMECIFDYIFNRIGVDDQIEHPVLLTECPCNPLYSRSKMAELLFETYSIPALGLGIDGVFSYLQNQRLGNCTTNGMVVCSGYTTTHCIPVYQSEPVLEACCRTNVGGYQVTDYMKRLLSLEYPYHVASLTWEKVEALKIEHGYIAEDYSSELKIFQKGGQSAEEKTRCWQLPWVPPPPEEKPSEEELARKAAIKEKQSQRLRDMAAAKRSNKIAELEIEIQGLEQIMEDIENVAEAHCEALLAGTGYSSRREVEAALNKATMSLKKAKGEPIKVEKETVEKELDAEKYPLLDIPNEMLTPEQLKEKKKQIFLKSTSEGRIRAKQKRQEEEFLREMEQSVEEDKRLANPEQYIEDLKARQAELAAKVEQRKKQKTNGGAAGSGGRSGLTSVFGGRSERLSAAQKERMKLLTTAAFDRGKEEDTFGMRDEDWQLYKKMGRDNDDDDEPDEDEIELNRVNARLQELDPTFNPAAVKSSAAAEAPQVRQLTAEDFRITLGIERFRCPEILFQPHLIGIDQVGLDEAIGVSMRRLPSEWSVDVATGTILLTGGNALFEGIDKRILLELKKNRPQGSTINIVRAQDPLLDAWRGAALYATTPIFQKCIFTKSDYEERGEDWLRQYTMKYSQY